ncbi:MAG: YjfB family protein [Nitrospinota bacterium]|nr:YjfB family protein [Nitrospinota bacterium]
MNIESLSGAVKSPVAGGKENTPALKKALDAEKQNGSQIMKMLNSASKVSGALGGSKKPEGIGNAIDMVG